jgi:hypothetical protein
VDVLQAVAEQLQLKLSWTVNLNGHWGLRRPKAPVKPIYKDK